MYIGQADGCPLITELPVSVYSRLIPRWRLSHQPTQRNYDEVDIYVTICLTKDGQSCRTVLELGCGHIVSENKVSNLLTMAF